MSKFPSAAIKASTEASLPVSLVLLFVILILSFPPALKKNLASSPPTNVNFSSTMCDVSKTAEATLEESSDPAVSAVAFTQPPCTSACKLAKSVDKADIAVIVSPEALAAVEVIDLLV